MTSACIADMAEPTSGGPLLTDLRATTTSQGTQAVALIRRTNADAQNRIELVTYDRTSKRVTARQPTALTCERVHMAGQTIFCLGNTKPNVLSPDARVSYAAHNARLEKSLAGEAHGITASRTRVSADAHYATTTTFLAGHSYSTIFFLTEALILDLNTKSTLAPLATWTILENGKPISEKEINLWGVTFNPQDSNQFLVTVGIKNNAYLARGQINTKRIELLKADVECPSFSPDGKRIAFKKRRPQSGYWDPAIMDMATLTETIFTENKSIDDQIEWLDEQTLIYESL